MAELGVQDFDLRLVANSYLSDTYTISTNFGSCCDPEYKLIFGWANSVVTGDRYFICWSYASGMLEVKSAYNASALGANYSNDIYNQQSIDTTKKRFLMINSEYCNLWSYDEDGNMAWVARDDSALDRISGKLICDPAMNFAISIRDSSNYVLTWSYTSVGVLYRAFSNVDIATVHYHVLDRTRSYYFHATNSNDPISSYRYIAGGVGGIALIDATGVNYSLDSEILVDEEFRFLIFIDNANNRIRFLSYNEDGTFGAIVSNNIAYTADNRIVNDSKLKILIIKDNALPYTYYAYKYNDAGAITQVSSLAVEAAEGVNLTPNRAIDTSNNMFFASNLINLATHSTLASYDYYRELTRDYTATAKPTHGRAALTVKYKSTASDLYKTYGELYE